MTPKQSQALQLIKNREIKGICERYVWKFTDGCNTYTAQVKALVALGLVNVTYFGGGEAAVNYVGCR